MRKTETKTTYVCDMCGTTSEEKMYYLKVPVLTKSNEYGVITSTRYEIVSLDLCEKCAKKVTVIEQEIGMVYPPENEGKYRWIDQTKS